MKIKTLVVDDEPKARRIITSLLEEYCQPIEVVAQVESVRDAVVAINTHQPDLVFLDIEMPEKSGFALFDSFPNPKFKTVFVTAYDQYAIQAFKVAAFGYILKPVKIDDLEQTVQRVRQELNDGISDSIADLLKTLSPNATEQTTVRSRLALPSRTGIEFVEQKDIEHLKADGSYTEVYCTDGSKKLVSKKMGELEPLLKPELFFRTHRSIIVNLDCIDRYVYEGGGYLVTTNEHTLAVSRDKKEELLSLLKG